MKKRYKVLIGIFGLLILSGISLTIIYIKPISDIVGSLEDMPDYSKYGTKEFESQIQKNRDATWERGKKVLGTYVTKELINGIPLKTIILSHKQIIIKDYNKKDYNKKEEIIKLTILSGGVSSHTKHYYFTTDEIKNIDIHLRVSVAGEYSLGKITKKLDSQGRMDIPEITYKELIKIK
jgi:hypothetical protein